MGQSLLREQIMTWQVVETKLTSNGPEIQVLATTVWRHDADGIAAMLWEQHENMYLDGQHMFSYAVKLIHESKSLGAGFPSHRMGGIE